MTTLTLTLQPQAVPLVKAGLEMKRRALEFGLRRYRERLTTFEKRYGLNSRSFARKFDAGELGDESDWFEWQYIWESFLETRRQLELLEGIAL